MRWLANAGLLNESSVCNLVDWTLRNESRYRRGSLGTAVKTTSILRDQHGRYAAIRHSSISKEADYATLWNPQDQTSTLGFNTIDGNYPPMHLRDQTIITTRPPNYAITIEHRERDPALRTPRFNGYGNLISGPFHQLGYWSFFIEQDGTRYAYEHIDIDALMTGKTRRPRIYEPVTHRGRFLGDTERQTSTSMKQDFRIMDEITTPLEYAQNWQMWIDAVESIYDEHVNNPDSHQTISRGLSRLAVNATEAIEGRFYDRRRWEYMGHIAINPLTREIDQDMFDVPYELYRIALKRAESYTRWGLLPNIAEEVEGKSYMYRILAGLSREGRSHLLSFQRKPKRVRRTTQRKFQNCQSCRHWARASKYLGNCRSDTARMKIFCVNGEHQEGRQGHAPTTLRTSPAFGCTEFSPKE